MDEMRGTAWERVCSVKDEAVIKAFARFINDNNPIHHDHEAAVAAGFLGIIAPAVMLEGFISSAIGNRIPGAALRRKELEFLWPLYAGTTPVVKCTIVKARGRIAHIEVQVKNMEAIQEVILAQGLYVLSVPERIKIDSIAA